MAIKLLEAAKELGLAASVVATSSDGDFGFSFVVPAQVYEKAYSSPEGGWGADDPQADEAPAPKPKNKGGRPRKVAAPVDEAPEG